MYHMMITNNNDNKYNTESNNDSIECPICLEVLKNDDAIYIVKCCNKVFHISCLINWYEQNPSNTHCLMCNQYNNFSNDFLDFSHNNAIEIHLDPSLEIDNNNNNPDISFNSSLIINNNTWKYKFIFTLLCLIFVFTPGLYYLILFFIE